MSLTMGDKLKKLSENSNFRMNLIQKLDYVDRKISNWIAEKSAKYQKITNFLALSGNFQPWIIISLIFFIFGVFLDRTENLVQITLLLITGIFTTIVKYTVKRRRPRENISAKYIGKIDFWSFPSGHAGRMGSLALLLSLFYPPLSPLFILWCLGVCYARIALQIHYFFDVIAGFLIGIIVACAGYLMFGYLSTLYHPLVQWVDAFL